ncbi:hypothetical protein J6590_063536 [Homalodisca vitripennis]|nr:hypothetical protein J6590_063536 [Homalodisca vitripennis]
MPPPTPVGYRHDIADHVPPRHVLYSLNNTARTLPKAPTSFLAKRSGVASKTTTAGIDQPDNTSDSVLLTCHNSPRPSRAIAGVKPRIVLEDSCHDILASAAEVTKVLSTFANRRRDRCQYQ